MNIVGRYHRVRTFGASGVSAPYVWDRGRAQERPRMIPAPYDRGERLPGGGRRYGEWVRTPEGVWLPQIAGGVGTYMDGGYNVPRGVLLRQGINATGQTTLALDSAYTNASAGDAIGHRFSVNVADTLASVYVYITSYTGTAANVNDLSLELRNNSGTTGPSSTLHEGQVLDPAATTGWRVQTGWTFSLVADTLYWLVCGDADGNGTDFATVLRDYTGIEAIAAAFGQSAGAQTTDGWASVRTFSGRIGCLVLLLGSGRTIGAPFGTGANSTNTTNQRGLRFIAPTTAKLYGSTFNTAGSAFSGIRLWRGSGGPSGSPAAGDSGATDLLAASVAGNPQGFAFETPPTITQGETLRCVYTYGSATSSPAKNQIGAGADATLRSAMWGNGTAYWAEASGTTDWSNDNISEFPQMDLILDDYITASAGSGGGLRVAGRGGLIGRA